MRNRRGLGRQSLIAIIFVIAVAIPVYFISDAYLEREDMALVARLDRTPTETATATNTPMFPPTWTPRPSSTPSDTPTPFVTPTELLIPMTGYDFSQAYIKNVVHLPDAGGRTMVTIVVSGILDGEFFAQVEIDFDTWVYDCVILDGNEDHLFCFGDRLPTTHDASIRVFEDLGESEGSQVVFEERFEVSMFVPTKTNTPSGPVHTATFTSTPTQTLIPTITPTPTPTPTSTDLPTPPPPQETPITPTAGS